LALKIVLGKLYKVVPSKSEKKFYPQFLKNQFIPKNSSPSFSVFLILAFLEEVSPARLVEYLSMARMLEGKVVIIGFKKYGCLQD